MSNSQKISSFSKTIVSDANGNTISLNLPNVSVTGTSNLGSVANVHILGGSNNQVLSTDGTGNLSWKTPATPNSQPGGSNTSVQYNDNGVLAGGGDFLYNSVTRTVTQPNTVVTGTATHQGITQLGDLGNVKITGGTSGQAIVTDGSGNLSWGNSGSGGTVTQVDTTGGGLGFQLSGGPITTSGTVNLGVPTATDLRNSLSIGDVANKFFNGSETEFLNGVGEWTTTPRGIDIAVDGTVVAPVSNVINFVDNTRPNNRIHFDVLSSNVEATIDPLSPIDIQSDVIANGFSARDIANGKMVTLRSYSTVENQVYDLPSDYPLANLQVLAANISNGGYSKMEWINLQNAQPFISFSVFQEGNGQQFTNANLATFTNGNYAGVFKNGTLLRPSDYVITGTTLVVNTYLQAEDTIDILPTSASMAGGSGGGGGGNADPVGLNGQLQYNDEGSFGASQAMSFDKTTGRTTLSILSSNLANIVTANITSLTWGSASASEISVSNVVSNLVTANNLSVTTTANIANLTVTTNTSTANLTVTTRANIANLLSNVANITTLTGTNANISTVQTTTLVGGNGSFTGNLQVVGVANVSTLSAGTGVVANLQVSDTAVFDEAQANLIQVANLTVTNSVTTTGNIGALNLNAVEQVVAGGNVVGGNLVTSGAVYADLDSYFNEDIYVSGNLNVTGNINTTDLSNVTIANATIALGTGDNPPLTFNDGKDRGILMYYYDDVANTQKIAFTGWDIADREMIVASDITDANGIITYNQLANLRANTFIGNVRANTVTNGNSNITISDTEITLNIPGAAPFNQFKFSQADGAANVKKIIASEIVAPDNVFGSTLTLGTGVGASTENKVIVTTPYFVFDSYLSEEMRIVTTDNTVRMFGDWNAGYPGAKSPANIFLGNTVTTTTIAGNVNVGRTITTDIISGNTFAFSKGGNLGNVSNLIITGGSAGQYLQTNGNGNLTWAAISGGSAITNGNSNVNVGANSNVTVSVAGNANVVTVTGTGANVSGTLNVTGNVLLTGNSVALGNVGNVKITGGSNNQILTTDGSGNLNWRDERGVQYLYAKRTTNQTISSGNWQNRTLICNVVDTNNGFTYNSTTGVLTLNAGTTYRISAGASWDAAATYYYQLTLVDANSNVKISPSFESLNGSQNNVGPGQIEYIYTPATTQNVKVLINSPAAGGEEVRGDIATYFSAYSIAGGVPLAAGGWTGTSDWAFGATTTPPSLATANLRFYSWRVDGKMMYLRGFYSQDSANGATSGIGEYLLTIPGGYQIDIGASGTAPVGTDVGVPLGSLTLDLTNTKATGYALAYDTTRVKFVTWQITTSAVLSAEMDTISSTYQNLNAFNKWKMMFDLAIPIL